MKIKTKLTLNAVVSICLAFLVGITLSLTFRHIQRRVVENGRVSDIVEKVNDLARATSVYSLRLNEEKGAQWQQKYYRLQGLLSGIKFFDENEKMLILDRISENNKGLRILFDRIRTESKGPTAPSNLEKSHSDQIYQFIEQVTKQAEMMASDAALLTQSNNAGILSSVRDSFIFLIALVVPAIIFVSSTSLLMRGTLVDTIREFERWADMIGARKWGYKVDIKRKDETSKLARAFNEMTSELSVSYSALENEIAGRKQAEEILQKRTSELDKRTKEMRCLFTICDLIEKQGTEEEILNKIVEIIPSGWRYPEIACSRITLDGKEFKAEKFRATSWKQTAEIISRGQKIGTVEIYYLEEKPVGDEEPFLKQERDLLDAIAREIEEVVERKRAEQKAEVEHSFRKAIEDSIFCGIAAVDLEGKQIYVNPAFCKMVGWGEEELLGAMPPFVYWPPEEIENIRSHFEEILRGWQPSGTLEVRFQRRSGERFDVLLCHSPLRDSQGNLIGYVGSIGDITTRKRTEDALKNSERQLKQLAAQVLDTQEEERKRVAVELHDSIVASLLGIKIGIETVLDGMRKSTATYRSLSALVVRTQQTVEEVRRIIANLRPFVLDHLGVKVAIDWFCREFQKTYSQMAVHKKVEIDEEQIPDSLKTVIFRILQEAMNNIAKHSAGNLVHVCLAKSNSKIELSVEDNGIGFSSDEIFSSGGAGRGLGLISMRERIQLSGGSFEIESIKEKGTTIRAAWPC